LRGWGRLPIAIALAVAAALPVSAPAAADDFTPAQKKAIEAIVHDYLTNHPDVLIDALQAADAKMKSEAREKAQQTLAERRKEVFDDPATPIGGNPHGDAALVEFFDYRCPYCKEVQPSIDALLGQDHGLRVIYKEFPVLGPISVTAAHAALAARKQGKYDAFHDAMMAAKGQVTDDTVYAIAASVGLDVGRLKRDMAGPEIDGLIKANFDLAEALDIRGTPAFIVGDKIIPGAVDLNSLKQAIADSRGK
jgi:protein-disulfide isomerase